MTILPANPSASGLLRLDVVLYADVAARLVAPDLGGLRAARPEFVAGSWTVVASVADAVVGCARAEPTPIPFPGDGPARLDRDRLGSRDRHRPCRRPAISVIQTGAYGDVQFGGVG